MPVGERLYDTPRMEHEVALCGSGTESTDESVSATKVRNVGARWKLRRSVAARNQFSLIFQGKLADYECRQDCGAACQWHALSADRVGRRDVA